MAILKSWQVLEAAKAKQQQEDTKEQAARRLILSLLQQPVQPVAAGRGFVLWAVPWPCVTGLLLEGRCPWGSRPEHLRPRLPRQQIPHSPCAQGGFPCQRPSHGSWQRWVHCSASPAALQDAHTASHPHTIAPLPVIIHHPHQSFPDACSLNSPSMGRDSSDLHRSRVTQHSQIQPASGRIPLTQWPLGS